MKLRCSKVLTQITVTTIYFYSLILCTVAVVPPGSLSQCLSRTRKTIFTKAVAWTHILTRQNESNRYLIDRYLVSLTLNSNLKRLNNMANYSALYFSCFFVLSIWIDSNPIVQLDSSVLLFVISLNTTHVHSNLMD